MKKTKIVCTIGPASQSIKTLTDMAQNGMNVARLNFSHGDHENHLLLMQNIRKVSINLGEPIAIIQDLHGPKIRVGAMKNPGLSVKIGQEVIIGEDFEMDTAVIDSIRPKQRILIEDGLIELEVKKILRKKVYCMVLSPGKIFPNKGINLPRTRLKIPILTKKDIYDLKFGLKNDVDYIALSFVRSRADVLKLKKLIAKYNPKGNVPPRIIAKIEKPEAVKNFDGILREADAIMVARGDLGVEMPESEVPIIQKTIIQKCLAAAKPVIVATQMLDSMIRNPRPTRAEVSDVANAVIDQTDAVMLSGESAFGRYPVKAVAQMNRIIETTEKSVFVPGHQHLTQKIVNKSEAIAESVFDLAVHTNAKVIVGATESGYTARQVVYKRPHHAKVLMLTPVPKVRRQMCLLWGVQSFLAPEVKTFEELMKTMLDTVRKTKLAKKGDKIVVVTGEPFGKRENLNLVEIKAL